MPLPFADRPIPTAADLERSKPAVVSAIEGAALRPEEPYAPGRPWTRRTLAWHIVDTEAAMANRLCRILAEDRPALVGIPQDIWAMGLPQRRNPVIAASWFQTTRAMVVDLLQDLPVSAWERTGTHSEYGAMRFADVLRHLHEHAWHHAEQLDSTFSPEAAPTKTMSHAVTLHRLEDRPRDAADFRIIRIAALRSDPDAFGETYDSVRGMDELGWAERLRTLLIKPGNALFLARSGASVIGMAGFGLHVQDSACGVMWGVYVVEDHRGTGLAERLMAAGQDYLQTLGIRRIEARVSAPNGRAIAFYRRLGFTIGPVSGTLRTGSIIPVHLIHRSIPDATSAHDKPCRC